MSSILDGTFAQDGGMVVRKGTTDSVIISRQQQKPADAAADAFNLTLNQFLMTRAANGGWLVHPGGGGGLAGMAQPLGAFTTFEEAVEWLRQKGVK
ncbi:MAG TPA: hypothetical protein VK602_00420 [Phyllobacterium sp.]|nr:hypothetical protein [Phyllobacterium sp.]